MQVSLGDNIIDVIIEYKNNKNLYIRIKDDLKMYVTCNKYTSIKKIKDIIKENEKSLLKMYNHQVNQKEKDNHHYFLGKKYIVIYDNSIKKIEVLDNCLYVKDEKMLNNFYKKACIKIFNERLDKCASLFNNIPDYKLRIRKMSTRWGVNNRGNNTITLNSELIKKDITLIDYVCIHELSHFIHANHSKLFWDEVGKRYPNYKEARRRLRD